MLSCIHISALPLEKWQRAPSEDVSWVLMLPSNWARSHAPEKYLFPHLARNGMGIPLFNILMNYRNLHRKPQSHTSLTLCRITSRKKHFWVSHRAYGCLWITLSSTHTKIILVFDCIIFESVFTSAPFAFPCEAIAVLVLLLTTTCTVVISITGFLPKPKYSQTPSEQALRDSSKLGGISRRAVFSVFLLAEWVRGSAANQAKAGRPLEQKHRMPRLLQEDVPIFHEVLKKQKHLLLL